MNVSEMGEIQVQIARIEAAAREGFAELEAERDQAIRERDQAIADAERWRARAYALAGPNSGLGDA